METVSTRAESTGPESGDEGRLRAAGRIRTGSEMQVHCYRILGSVADAEDALQETLMTAWQGLGGFEGRSAIRTWLYRHRH